MERTPGRATLTSWVVGPLHSYTQEGWVDNNNMVCGMFVWCSLCVSMLTVSNALFMPSATVIVHSCGLFWLKPVAMVLFMLCSAVLVESLLLKPCCV